MNRRGVVEFPIYCKCRSTAPAGGFSYFPLFESNPIFRSCSNFWIPNWAPLYVCSPLMWSNFFVQFPNLLLKSGTHPYLCVPSVLFQRSFFEDPHESHEGFQVEKSGQAGNFPATFDTFDGTWRIIPNRRWSLVFLSLRLVVISSINGWTNYGY